MNLRLIRVKNIENQHVSVANVDDFETSIMELSNVRICQESEYMRKFVRPFAAKVINRLTPKSLAPVFCISMGVTCVSRSVPHMFFSTDNLLYLFDAWTETYGTIQKIVKAYNIEVLFITSKESTANLQALLPDTYVIWCPEGYKAETYKAFDYPRKDIDVLQMGRKYDLWHYQVVDKLLESGISYLYEKTKGEVVFKSRADFIDGLGRSKISVCFPKSLTHNNEANGITTMTNRYLQSFASKCLVLGTTPDEMKELFGYDPVLPVDMTDPAGQIVEILKNYNGYTPLIEKNYNECLKNHTWHNRWMKILDIIQQMTIWNKEGKGQKV
jgi:hypothetical protein